MSVPGNAQHPGTWGCFAEAQSTQAPGEHFGPCVLIRCHSVTWRSSAVNIDRRNLHKTDWQTAVCWQSYFSYTYRCRQSCQHLGKQQSFEGILIGVSPSAAWQRCPSRGSARGDDAAPRARGSDTSSPENKHLSRGLVLGWLRRQRRCRAAMAATNFPVK